MTREAVFTDTMTEFSAWLRALSYPLDSRVISNHNLDYIWHNYRESWLILIEEKRFGAKSTRSQVDTHSVVDQMLTYASGMVVETLRGPKPIDYRGYYLIQFSATTPDDSEWMRINGESASADNLLHLLTTGAIEVVS